MSFITFLIKVTSQVLLKFREMISRVLSLRLVGDFNEKLLNASKSLINSLKISDKSVQSQNKHEEDEKDYNRESNS